MTLAIVLGVFFLSAVVFRVAFRLAEYDEAKRDAFWASLLRRKPKE